MNDIYKVLIECFSKLDTEIFKDDMYNEASRKLDEALSEYDKLELSEEKDKVVRHVFDMYIEQSARYVELAYRNGFDDAVHILKEIGVI